MKILKVISAIDVPSRYNYQTNYGIWNYIKGDFQYLEHFYADLNEYDVVFIPMYCRSINNMDLINRIKDHKVKTVLWENDNWRRSFDDDFYKGFDYILYRYKDMNGNIPLTPSMRHLWSVNTDLFTPKYGGSGVAFNCTVDHHYPLRQEVKKYNILKYTSYKGLRYIQYLQECAGGLHISADPKLTPMVLSKVLEFGACGCQIISNTHTKDMELYFPKELIYWFSNIDELRIVLKHFLPNQIRQQELYNIVLSMHSHQIRAKQIMDRLNTI